MKRKEFLQKEHEKEMLLKIKSFTVNVLKETILLLEEILLAHQFESNGIVHIHIKDIIRIYHKVYIS